MTASITSVLLLIALCVGTAVSLQCYTCAGQSSNANCQTASTCTGGETYCETTVGSAGISGYSVTSISKSCSLSCTPVNSGISVVSASVSCCTTDLCNTSGGTNIKYSFTAIILALGFILLKNSLM
ncbi:lymphocyte antigen 6E-like [Mixophyes fleayi]|uniref:lymphocyte antigen 6E-like n=1 Tax=Mixophyes fleayi TaxID=3061075 RepID=UPI003F4DDDC1